MVKEKIIIYIGFHTDGGKVKDERIIEITETPHRASLLIRALDAVCRMLTSGEIG